MRHDRPVVTRMPAVSFPGSYEDDQGLEPLVWRIEPTERYGPKDQRYEIHTVLRGVAVWGFDFDGLEPADTATGETGLSLNTAGELDLCVLCGDLPCTVEVHGDRRAARVRFRLDLRIKEPVGVPRNLHLAMTVDGVTYEVADDWFEDGLQRLEAAFPPGIRLVCCVTCLYSDYSPGGHGLMGIRCHREAKAQYLAVRSKADYWPVPVTEEVPETYLCPDYQRRIPGTGYRG